MSLYFVQLQMPTDLHIADSILRCISDFASLKRPFSFTLRREETAYRQPREDIHRLQIRRYINAITEAYENTHYFLKLGKPLKAIERFRDAMPIVPYILVDPDLFLLIRLIQIATWSSWKKVP
jgi:hypothetical protein